MGLATPRRRRHADRSRVESRSIPRFGPTPERLPLPLGNVVRVMTRGVKGGGPPLEDNVKFDRLVDRSEECHIWRGSVSNRYGCIRLKLEGVWKSIRTNRFALERKLGRPILPGMNANHTCHNTVCVNPDHLYEGTQRQNVTDTIVAGRRDNPTACPNGHPYTQVNQLPIGHANRRRCRECRNASIRRWAAKKRDL